MYSRRELKCENIVRLSQCVLHTTCLEIGPELPVFETRHGNGGRKASYPARSEGPMASFSADVYDFRESAVNQFQGKVASSFKTCYHGKPFGMLDCKGDLRMLRVFESNMRKVLRSALCEVEEKSGVQTVELRLTVDLVTSCIGPM